MNDESNTISHDVSSGVKVNAGDSMYIPAGGLQIWAKDDGTLGFGVTVAVDPWLPDLSATLGTSLGVIEAISRDGFPVGAICNRGSIYACRKSQKIQDLISHPEIQRLNHMAVIDGQRAIGVLDLDKVRGRFQHGDTENSLLVEKLYDPANKSNTMREASPLLDYLLTADQQPFRLIELDGGSLATVDVEDLQRVPVRAILLMWFSYLESLLSQRLCQKAPELREIVGAASTVEAAGLGRIGPGPERKIERYKFGQLLKEADGKGIVNLVHDEVELLNQYRNRIFHGPRWYMTRRHEVSSLVNCVKKVVSLARELDSKPQTAH